MKEIKRKKKEYCPDPTNEFDCPYLDPETRELLIIMICSLSLLLQI